MIISVPKERKNNECRVSLTPEAVKILAKRHPVTVEKGAGLNSNFSDGDFIKAGATITNSDFNWALSDIIVKVKEPLNAEMEQYKILMPRKKLNDLILFSFLHLPANPAVKKFVVENKIKAIPYENIQLADGSRPILAEMSKIAAEVSVDAAAHYLRKENGGKGKLLKDAMAIVFGCEGVLGKTAMNLLFKRGAYVVGFDRSEKGYKFMARVGKCYVLSGIEHNLTRGINATLLKADLIICAAAAKNKKAPKLITAEMLKLMEPGSVIIDPSIDEGGCCETSRPTTHDNPVFVEKDIIHYCVANMPGTVPLSSTPVLAEKILPYVLEVADKGWEKALAENPILAQAAKIE